MIHTIEEFHAQCARYISIFNAFTEKHTLIGTAAPDHICYKCDSNEAFEDMRRMLESESAYLYQSVISNRRIAYIKLKVGIETNLGMINFIELSDQKPDNSQLDGFDHIEAYPIGISYEKMVSGFEETEHVMKVERPHHTTHDIDMGDGFLFRCTREPLIDKIKRSEMI